jgi:hypothetical protein
LQGVPDGEERRLGDNYIVICPSFLAQKLANPEYSLKPPDFAKFTASRAKCKDSMAPRITQETADERNQMAGRE